MARAWIYACFFVSGFSGLVYEIVWSRLFVHTMGTSNLSITVVVATSIGEENTPIIELARSMSAGIFVGSIDNVLERYYLSALEFGGGYIVRVTGDNPFTDPEYASMADEIALESSADLCSLSILPLGPAVEII